MFYFQDPVLNGLIFAYIIILSCTKYLFQSNLLAGSDGVVWFGFNMISIGLEWFMLIYLIKLVWCGFGLDPKPLAPCIRAELRAGEAPSSQVGPRVLFFFLTKLAGCWD